MYYYQSSYLLYKLTHNCVLLEQFCFSRIYRGISATAAEPVLSSFTKVYTLLYTFCSVTTALLIFSMASGNALSRSLPELDTGPQGQPILVQNKESPEGWAPKLTESSPTTKVYKRRWIIVTLFCLYSMSNAYQWIHLNIIANIITKYYNASLPEDRFQRETTVDWLSMIYMLAYIPLIFPSTFLLNKKGLRVCAIAGAFLNVLGAWLKVACISPDRFAVLMFAQTVCAIAQIFILGLPAKIAAVWFGPNEVSTATSLGVFGNQV